MVDISRIETNSLRSGGATAAANAGVSERLFLRHGRWSGVSVQDSYFKDSLTSRLYVSKALSIYFFSFDSIFVLVGLPGRPSDLGYSWPGVFLSGASGRTERFFTQLLFHNSISVSLCWF